MNMLMINSDLDRIYVQRDSKSFLTQNASLKRPNDLDDSDNFIFHSSLTFFFSFGRPFYVFLDHRGRNMGSMMDLTTEMVCPMP